MDSPKILNLAFTLPKEYYDAPPRSIPGDSVFTSNYISTSVPLEPPDCPYLVWNELEFTPDELRLSRSVMPRREILQLYQTDYEYTIIVHSNRYVQFLNIIYDDNAAYPLVDSSGNTLPIMIGKHCFRIQSMNLLAVKLIDTRKDDIMISMSITASKKQLAVASLTGRVCLKSRRNKTEYVYSKQYVRIPSDKYRELSDRLFNENRSHINYPCVGTFPPVLPGPPYITNSGIYSDIDASNSVELIGASIEFWATAPYRYIYFYGLDSSVDFCQIVGLPLARSGWDIVLPKRKYRIDINATIHYSVKPSSTSEIWLSCKAGNEAWMKYARTTDGDLALGLCDVIPNSSDPNLPWSLVCNNVSFEFTTEQGSSYMIGISDDLPSGPTTILDPSSRFIITLLE